MAYTVHEAIALLDKHPADYDTPDELRGLLAQVSIDRADGLPHGSVTVLYSGNTKVGTGSESTTEIAGDGVGRRGLV